MNNKEHLIKDMESIIENIDEGSISISGLEHALRTIFSELTDNESNIARDMKIICDNIKRGITSTDQIKSTLKIMCYEQYKLLSNINNTQSVYKKKEDFYGTVGIAASIGFKIEAETPEEARNKMLSMSCIINLYDADGNEIKITEQDWAEDEFTEQGNDGLTARDWNAIL